jgi:hypothetical protein
VPQLYSYVLLRDYGFAPNPFHGTCTLATCKPRIRDKAGVGDYVFATGTIQRFPPGKLVYAMRVTDTMTFDGYWAEPRFAAKRPVLNGSTKWQYGDNIYHHVGGRWIQADSHHSYDGGGQNEYNLARDTSVDRVLVSEHFTYWGREGPAVSAQFREWNGVDVVNDGRGHRCQFDKDLVEEFVAWLEPLLGVGYCGRPFSW